MADPPNGRLQVSIDGRWIDCRSGETVLEVARRAGAEIPTLCHDPRLAPAGACRTCLVEIDGWRRLVPSCATEVQNGMMVATHGERIARHQRALLALYVADTAPVPERQAPSQLEEMAAAVNAPTDWPKIEPVRADRADDRNPYIEFRADRCISCARCTRYCAEVESVSAIALTGRGAHTTISTVDSRSLLDTTCEMCGGCIDVCPTGAMHEKLPMTDGLDLSRPHRSVRTTCNYCGVGCQMDLHVDPRGNQGRGRVLRVASPPPGTEPNDGNLCVKGRFAYNFIHHDDRLTAPVVRQTDGSFKEVGWKQALDVAAQGLLRVAERHGADALGFVSSSRCTTEENYLVQKLARAAFGTNNCHQCAAT